MIEFPQPTAVGAVIDAAVPAFGQIAGLKVVDDPTPQPTKGDMLLVGYGATSSATVRQEHDPQGRVNESGDILCSLWSWSGSKGMKARRDRCRDVLAQMRQIMLADPTMGGACIRVRFGDRWSWLEQAGAEGAACSVGLTLHYVAVI